MKILVILLVLVALTIIGDVMPNPFQENYRLIKVNANPPQEGQGRRHNSCPAQFLQYASSKCCVAFGRSYNYIPNYHSSLA